MNLKECEQELLNAKLVEAIALIIVRPANGEVEIPRIFQDGTQHSYSLFALNTRIGKEKEAIKLARETAIEGLLKLVEYQD